MLSVDQKLITRQLFRSKECVKGITSGKLKPQDHLNLINMVVDEFRKPLNKANGSTASTVGKVLSALA